MSSRIAEDPWIMFLGIRLLSTVLVRTWFVADEYWQATEIGHHMAFGYGYRTWEWQHGIRSAVYPAVFGGLFRLLGALNLDYPFMLIECPRLLHALAFSVGDYHIWKLSRKLYSQETAKWTSACLSSSWFLEYCAPRTLTSSAETVLSSVALWHYPWKEERESDSTSYLWLVGVACVIRPTAAILFLPLCLSHLWNNRRKCVLILKYLAVIFIVLILSVLVDSWYYGYPILVPWRFAHFNVISGLASHYGTHPWHWYLTQGIPVTLMTHLVPYLLAVVYYPGRHKALLPLSIWCIFVYSCLSHKEFRFLLPILPLCHCMAADYISQDLLSRSKKSDSPDTCSRRALILTFLLLPNFVVLLYTGLVHQRGPLDTMNVLRQEIALSEDPNILFLMPCHSTPYYSYLHKDVSLRFLTCEPNLKHKENYLDEADIFEKDPLTWLHQEYVAEVRSGLNASHAYASEDGNLDNTNAKSLARR